jgi:hypothetical protein
LAKKINQPRAGLLAVAEVDQRLPIQARAAAHPAGGLPAVLQAALMRAAGNGNKGELLDVCHVLCCRKKCREGR